MTDTNTNTDTAIAERDEAIAASLEAGGSVRRVRQQFGLSAIEMDAVLVRLFPVDNEARLRMVRADLGKLDRLAEVFYAKALAGDVQSSLATVKLWERKHQLLGLDQPTKLDIISISAQAQQTPRHNKIREAIFNMARGPDWKPNGGDGAVDTLSDSADDDQSG